MEFMTGVKKKEDISVKTLLETPEGTEVKLEGAVHIIRDMGEVAFVILRTVSYTHLTLPTILLV